MGRSTGIAYHLPRGCPTFATRTGRSIRRNRLLDVRLWVRESSWSIRLREVSLEWTERARLTNETYLCSSSTSCWGTTSTPMLTSARSCRSFWMFVPEGLYWTAAFVFVVVGLFNYNIISETCWHLKDSLNIVKEKRSPWEYGEPCRCLNLWPSQTDASIQLCTYLNSS